MHHSKQKCVHFCSERCIVGYGTGASWDLEQKCVHFCSEWCIVGYGTGASWDLWDRSIACCYDCGRVPTDCWYSGIALQFTQNSLQISKESSFLYFDQPIIQPACVTLWRPLHTRFWDASPRTSVQKQHPVVFSFFHRILTNYRWFFIYDSTNV